MLPRRRLAVAPRVVIVGGGIAGLAIASELSASAADLVVVEGSQRPGGNIRSTREEGFLYEWGPTGFLDNVPETLVLAARAGIAPRLTRANEAAERRFVIRGGRLRELPHGPLGFFTSGVISPAGRARVLGEPFVPRRRETSDESVLAFATRRIGREAAEVLVDALVTGIWAGDSERLSVASAFPKLAALEREYGGLVRGMIGSWRKLAGGGPAGPGGKLTSFPDGLQELPEALAANLGERLVTGTPVRSIVPRPTSGWRVEAEGSPPLEADVVVLACPAWAAAGIVAGLDPALAEHLAAVPTVPVAVVHLGFEKARAKDKLPGFGALAPRGETKSLLGVLVPSNIFPDRAPSDAALATAMLGGARDPSIVERDDAVLIARALEEIRAVTGLDAEPRFVRVLRHARGIPQYNLGHGARLAAIDAAVAAHRGLFLAGNSYRGIAINACAADAPKVARSILDAF
jgi:protoporphyrinogen/coproporphyrinogen III oxidase